MFLQNELYVVLGNLNLAYHVKRFNGSNGLMLFNGKWYRAMFLVCSPVPESDRVLQ